jgi:hypothetical protein
MTSFLRCLIVTLESPTACSYKLQVGSLIYFVNPCHLITAAQIYLLCTPFSRRTVAVYYSTINYAFGPLTAVLLPVLNTRTLRGEQAVYWVQVGAPQNETLNPFHF